MERPSKKSNLVDQSQDKLGQYVKDLEWDLKKLFAQFNKSIAFNAIKVGSTNGYAQIDSGGTITLAGSATVWDDLRVPLTQTKLGANLKPDFDETNVGYLFPQNDPTEILYTVVQMPHDWKLGSTIFPHVHWVQGMSSSAIFNIDYKWVKLAGSTTGAFTTFAMASTDFAWSSGTTMQQISTNTAGLSGSSISTLSSIIALKLYRQDNAYPGDALTYEFDIHYEIDSLGSNSEYSK